MAAFGALLRRFLDMSAVMADEGAAEAMLDQPRRTVRTLEAMTAGPAER
jgi:hypothetical protein